MPFAKHSCESKQSHVCDFSSFLLCVCVLFLPLLANKHIHIRWNIQKLTEKGNSVDDIGILLRAAIPTGQPLCVTLNSPLWKMAPLLAVLLSMASSSSKLQNKLKRTLTQTHRGVSGHPAQMISACQSPADPTPSYFYTHITQDKIHINKINNLKWPMSHLLSATDDMSGHHTTPTLLRLLCYPPAAQEYTRFIWYNCTWLDAVS